MDEVTMRRSKLSAVLGLSLFVIAGAEPALAQTGSSEPNDLFYEFSDDDLLADTISSHTAILRIRPPAAKVSLIRPRASFIAEMFKSVEAL
jgi:hypothetical protein